MKLIVLDAVFWLSNGGILCNQFEIVASSVADAKEQLSSRAKLKNLRIVFRGWRIV